MTQDESEVLTALYVALEYLESNGMPSSQVDAAILKIEGKG